ncbi:transposable element Tc1 transposase [Trichonephila clavipes]|nr:transposable element Tc1 transposase [Trichonephila clavipes]
MMSQRQSTNSIQKLLGELLIWNRFWRLEVQAENQTRTQRETTPNEDRSDLFSVNGSRHRNMNATLQQHLRFCYRHHGFNSDCPKPAPWCREDEFLAANHPDKTLQELERALLEEWDRIPQLVINSLIDSMPQRCSTLLAVHGNHTPTENDFL